MPDEFGAMSTHVSVRTWASVLYNCVCVYICAIQCRAVITRSIFCKIFTKDMWGVSCAFSASNWFSAYNAVCNIVILDRVMVDSTVTCIECASVQYLIIWMCMNTYVYMRGHDTMYWLIKNGWFGMNNVNLELYNRWIVMVLTHWGLDKMAAISQTTVSNSFPWMKIYEFWIKFHRSLFLRVQQTLFQHGSDSGLVSTRRQVIIWTHGGKITDAIICHWASMSLTTGRKILIMDWPTLWHEAALLFGRWWPTLHPRSGCDRCLLGSAGCSVVFKTWFRLRWQIPCGAVTTRSNFSEILIIDIPIARPLGWDVGCLLWVQILIYTPSQPLYLCLQYHAILVRVVAALDCGSFALNQIIHVPRWTKGGDQSMWTFTFL